MVVAFIMVAVPLRLSPLLGRTRRPADLFVCPENEPQRGLFRLPGLMQEA
jgi:hypothetical protein